MNPGRVPALQPYLFRQVGAGTPDGEERAKIENFLWDERPGDAAVDLYANRLGTGAVADLDDWHGRHNNFLKREIQIGRGKPEIPLTFRAINDLNRLRLIEPSLYLIRVEEATWPCDLAGIAVEDLRSHIEQFAKGDDAAKDFLKGLASRWNAKRDQRPLFATTELEVEDLLDDRSDWAERLRDRLGLGHYDPAYAGKPVEIVLMRYTVQEVLDSLDNGVGHPAVPTLLDGGLNPFFFPTPFPSEEGEAGADFRGHTLNLSPVAGKNEYSMGVEMLHPSIAYQPEHFYRVGVIANFVALPLEKARAFHLPWLQLNFGRDDFGAAAFGGRP